MKQQKASERILELAREEAKRQSNYLRSGDPNLWAYVPWATLKYLDEKGL